MNKHKFAGLVLIVMLGAALAALLLAATNAADTDSYVRLTPSGRM